MQRIIGGRYELSEELGGGAFGRVFRGRDLTLGAEVAVKEVWLAAVSETEHAQRLARAEREGRHAAQLRGHPNIVAVHDVVLDDGKPWIVMDYVEGRSLAQHLAAGPLPVGQVAAVARGLLSALGAAHEKGIVHRDVKPSNVMLADGGRVLLTDFGIAQHNSDTTITASNTLVGTLEYMPPERFSGQDSGPAGDLYSLGVTLFQAAEGFSPFHRDTPTETLTAVVLGVTPEPTQAGPLTPLIAALLAKDPAARPTVQQALAMLDGAAAPVAAAGPASAPTVIPQPAVPWADPATQGYRNNPAALTQAAFPAPAPPPTQTTPKKRKPVVLITTGGVLAVAAAVVAALTLGSNDHTSPSAATSTPTAKASDETKGGGAISSPPLPTTASSSTAAPASGILTVWLTLDADQLWPQAVKDATAAFNQTYPNVHVKLAYMSWDSYQTKVTTVLASGNPPDVMELDTKSAPTLIAAGDLTDITPDKANFDNSSTWRDALVQSCSANGNLFCVPYYAAEKDGAIVGGSDLAVPKAAQHAEWSKAWIKAFTATAVEQQIVKVGQPAHSTAKLLANTTTIS